ncbi:MAG TPA: hypothetical protein VIL18_02685 [Longimicrobiales bacterium]
MDALRGGRRPAALPGTLDDIAAYHRRRPPDGGATPVSDRVWQDLDMDAVFARVDRCASAVGQQVLYDLLRSPLPDPERVAERAALAQRLAEEPALRAQIERAMYGLRQRSAYRLPHLLFDELPRRPRFYLAFPALTVLAAAAIAGLFLEPDALFAVLAIVLLNVSIQAYYRPAVQHLVAPLASLRALLSAARRLAALDDPLLRPHTEALRVRCSRLRWIDRFVRHVSRETHGNELIEIAASYLNLVFLLDVNAFLFSIELIRAHREDLRAVFETAGLLDAMCSVARLRQDLPRWCVPEIAPARKEIVAEGIYHPLLKDPVANDLRIQGRALLITGSNMAGKTTYLRAVGLCALLAGTIATCPARRWRAPLLRIASLITRTDDLLGGRSYFLVEAQLVRELLALAETDVQHLFIIDEIFRGTNTRERLAAAKAVLEHLNRGAHVCLVSTHDLELLELLGPGWEFWHFRETVEDGGVRFDYKIRPGVSSAPNALRLLGVSGYPPGVIAEALRTYAALGDSPPAD